MACLQDQIVLDRLTKIQQKSVLLNFKKSK